jgi:hypothetical protein
MEPNKSFSFRNPVIARVAVLLFSTFFFLTCEKEPLNVGKNILPQEDSLGVVVDTLPVELHTLAMEPVYTLTRGTSPLGNVNDPLFGSVSCEFVTDFIYYSGFSFREGLDSVEFVDIELVLKFTDTYVNNTDINFNVYKLNEAIPSYAYSNFHLDPGLYNPVKLNIEEPEPEYENDTLGNEIIAYRVFLSDEFGESFLNPQLITDSAYYYDSVFRSYFHGLYIEVVEESENVGGLINISHYDSRILLRTEQTQNGTASTVENELVLGYPESGGTSINMYRSSFSSTINSVLNDTVNDQSVAYIQSLVGPKVLISIPGLFELRNALDHQASISLAQLVLPIDTATYDNKEFIAPRYLGIRDVVNDTNIIDDGLLPSYFGGILDTVNYEYRISLGNYVHNFLRGSMDLNDESLYLFGARYLNVTGYPADITYFSLITPGRVVLNSVNANKPPILRIIYSKLP